MGIPLTAREPIEFLPPALMEKGVRIICRVPTMYERDTFHAALARAGYITYSKAQLRQMAMAGVAALHGDQVEEYRILFEELWQHSDAANACEQRRQERLLEIMDALPEGAEVPSEDELTKDLEKIVPEFDMPLIRRSKVTAVQQDIMNRYEPMRQAFSDLAEQESKRKWFTMQTYVLGWKGLEFEPAGSGIGGITRPEAEWLRGQIGSLAWDQTAEFITAMHGIDEDEEKNLALLLESLSDQTGLTTKSETESSNEPGTLTDAPSTATLESGSPKMTESSISSTSTSPEKTDDAPLGQTAEA